MLESQVLSRRPPATNLLKERSLLIGFSFLVLAFVVAAFLFFSMNWVQLAIAVIPIALLLYVGVSQFSAKLIRPISDLASQTHTLAGGDLTSLVALPDQGELSALASDINWLARELRTAQGLIEEFRVSQSSTSQEKIASDELRLSYDNLLVVSELGQQIIASLRLEDIASTAYETLNTMMDAASLELATIDAASQSLNVILSIDGGTAYSARNVPLDSSSSFGAWVAVHGREVFLEDVETNYARYVRTLAPLRPGSEVLRSLICVPMSTKGSVVGVMSIGSYRKGAFTAYHLDMIKSLGLYVAVALDNAGAYHKLDSALTELKSAQRQLVQAEKMSSLGLLTAGIAHEINNPINFVSANINPLRRNLDDVITILTQYQSLDGEASIAGSLESIRKQEAKLDLSYSVKEISNLLDGIEEGATRTAEIVQGLRNFSRTDEHALKYADVRQGIDSTLTLLHNKYKNTVEIVREYGEIPEIECFAGQLNQIFMNILSNAIHAISENSRGTGTIRIRTEQKGTDDIEVRIKDDGTGMTEEVRRKIFDPFFTTKDVGVGTGLGLSISYGIIEKHGGNITVESTPGEGTEFIITLPIHQPEHAAEAR